jgi:hypothetical protein
MISTGVWRGGWAAAVALALVLSSARAARADVLHEAQELRRQLQYETAQEKLSAALPDLQGEEHTRALLLLASLTSDHKEARRLLHDAERATTSDATRREADLEMARLDYARGSYRGVQTRLREYAGEDPASALLSAQAAIALGETKDLHELLGPARKLEFAQLLDGWADREAGDAQKALSTFEQLAKQRRSDVLPTTLLWKAECQAALGLRDPALATCADLREHFGDSPEATLLEPTLASLRRAAPGLSTATAPEAPDRVVLQVGAFEDRGNALRYRERLARDVQHAQVEEIQDGGRRLFRVLVGPFETREAAESFGHAQLDPRGYTWRVARPGEP